MMGPEDKAAYSMQTGFRLARHLNEVPMSITLLVGKAIADQRANEIELWIQKRNSPNLYWALTQLPSPYFDMRLPMQGNEIVARQMMSVASLPKLEQVEGKALSPPEAQALLAKMYHNQGIHGTAVPEALRGPEGAGALYPTIMVLKNYPRAKRYLRDIGRTPEEIEAMPAPQVVLCFLLHFLRETSQDAMKWSAMPYWQARAPLIELDRRIKELGEAEDESLPWLQLTSAMSTVARGMAMFDRRIATLRLIEALRLHAAANGGSLPEKLADIRAVPVPIDPMSGKPFEYAKSGDGAILRTPPLEGEPANVTIRYEITMRKP
jgi:hypothetical protein